AHGLAAEPGAALPGAGAADDAQAGQPGAQLVRELGAFPVVVDDRQDVRVDVGADPVAQRPLAVGEFLVEQEVVAGGRGVLHVGVLSWARPGRPPGVCPGRWRDYAHPPIVTCPTPPGTICTLAANCSPDKGR